MRTNDPINADDAPLKRAIIAYVTNGDKTVVTAVPGKRIRLINALITVAAQLPLTWKSGANALSGAMPLGISATAGGGFIVPDGPGGAGYIETNTGEALVLNVGTTAIQVGGHIAYQVISPPKQE